MRKTEIVIFLMLGLLNRSFAQEYIRVADFNSFKKNFSAEAGKIQTITSSFTQEKILTALTEKITSTGYFAFKRNNKVRIEYVKPFQYVMIMNGNKMLIRDDQKDSKINIRSNKIFQQINKIIMDCIQGTILESKDFTSEAFENKKTYLVRLKPVTRTLQEFFDEIAITVDRNDFSVVKIEMNEPSTDQTILLFTNKKLNQPVSDEVFDL